MTDAYVESAESRALEPVPNTRGAHKAVLIGEEDGALNFAERRFVLEPGGRIPAHRHPDIEHEQYVLRGEMKLELDGETVTASAGDAVFIPATTVHAYENEGDQPVEFLCTVPITEDYETEWLEELEA
ncbi:MAG: cupin domain-containing protein [Bradymonadaceae bacterium]